MYSDVSMERYNTRNSPFLELKSPFTAWEAVKMALLLWTVIPRLLIIAIAMSTMAGMGAFATWGWPYKEKPLPPWRRRIVKASAFCTRIALWMLGCRFRLQGWENAEKAMKEGVQILMFNHASYVEAFIIVALFAPGAVTKESNDHLPILGGSVRALQNIYVPDNKRSRDIPKEANDTEKNAAKEKRISTLIAERAADRRYSMLAVAPEGTCGDGRCILQFRTGSFVAGAPILPIFFRYRTKYFNPAWTAVNLGWHVVRLMCQFGTVVDVYIHPTYKPSAEEKKDPAVYANKFRKFMAAETDLPMVDHSIEHYYALTKLDIINSWDGRSVVGPPGVIDEDGFVDLTKWKKKKV